jgi:hypothetical protein
MNVVPRVTGPGVQGKNHADNAFFHPDLVTDFELRLVGTARHGSMWCWLLHPFPLLRTKCDERISGS